MHIYLCLCLYLYLYFGLQIPWEGNKSCGEVKKRGFGPSVAGNVLGSDHLSLTKRTPGQWRRRTREALEPVGMQTNSWNHLWPGGRGGPRGPQGAKGHHTKGGAASSAKFSKMRLSADGSREIAKSLFV